MTNIPILTTTRFTMRPLREADTAALFSTFADEQQNLYMSRAHFTSEAELWGWLADPDWNGRTWIAEDSEGAVLGRFVAMPAHEDGVQEIGYVTVMHRQGEGIARECTEALVKHLLHEGARKLIAEVDVDNVLSIRLLESLGFIREAHLREHETTHIGLRDLYLYGLLARDHVTKHQS